MFQYHLLRVSNLYTYQDGIITTEIRQSISLQIRKFSVLATQTTTAKKKTLPRSAHNKINSDSRDIVTLYQSLQCVLTVEISQC